MRPEREHTIEGPHYDIVGHNPTQCVWDVPHCGPCWIPGEPRPANPWAKPPGWEAEQAAREARIAAERRRRDEQDRRAASVIAALGVKAGWDDYREQITLSLDEAGKLAALLSPEAGE